MRCGVWLLCSGAFVASLLVWEAGARETISTAPQAKEPEKLETEEEKEIMNEAKMADASPAPMNLMWLAAAQPMAMDVSADLAAEESKDKSEAPPKPKKTDKKPEEADKKPEEADKKPEEADKKPEKADKKPEEADKKPEEADKKPEKADKPEKPKAQTRTYRMPEGEDKAMPRGLEHTIAPAGVYERSRGKNLDVLRLRKFLLIAEVGAVGLFSIIATSALCFASMRSVELSFNT